MKILQVELMEAISRNLDLQDWITLVFLGILLLLALVKANYREEFYSFIRILFSDKYFRENQKSVKLFYVFTRYLFLVHAVIASLAIYIVLVYLKIISDKSFLLFTQILLLYSVFVVGKYLIEQMLGVLFSLEEVLREYVFFKITYKSFLAICIFPILVLLTYSWGGGLLFYKIAMVVLLLSNVLFLGYFYRRNDSLILPNLYYFILYLCIFEIAPYYIVYKIFIKA